MTVCRRTCVAGGWW